MKPYSDPHHDLCPAPTEPCECPMLEELERQAWVRSEAEACQVIVLAAMNAGGCYVCGLPNAQGGSHDRCRA